MNILIKSDQVEFKEKEILQEFRKMVSDVITKDHTNAVLIKYLRAKNFNLRKATNSFHEYMRFKKAFQLEYIDKLWEKLEELQNYEFMGEIGFAKDGTPIRYIAMGRGDFLGYMLSLDTFDIGRYCASIIERDLKKCREQSEKLKKEINEITYVIDMDSFTSRQVFSAGVVELGLDLFRLFQDYYPEVWKRVLIVNAPSYFSVAFNLFKPIFKRSLLKNIQVVSKDGTAHLLQKHVDNEVLPVFLGGKRVDSKGNAMCNEFIKFGGRVPETLFLRNRLPLLTLSDLSVMEVVLYPKRCYNHSVIVREENSVIRIAYRTEGGSVISNVLYRQFSSDSDILDLPSTDEYLDEKSENCKVLVISPTVHAQSHLVPTDNQFLAVNPGIYIIKFDNTHSWLSSRRILYKVTVLPPNSS